MLDPLSNILEFLSEANSLGPLALLANFAGGWLGYQLTSSWIGALVGIGAGFTGGFWFENSSSPSITNARRCAYAVLIVTVSVLIVRYLLAGR